MSQKKILTIAIISGLILVSLYMLLVSAGNNTVPVSTSDDFYFTPEETTNSVEMPSDEVQLLKSQSGNYVETDDFISKPTTELIDDTAGVYRLAAENTPEGPLYEIYYYAGGSITVSLLDTNLKLARFLAIEKLKTVLGISDYDLCVAEISVTTNRYVSEDYAGKELGIEGCPGSVVF